jgi:hypothetical protein
MPTAAAAARPVAGIALDWMLITFQAPQCVDSYTGGSEPGAPWMGCGANQP